MRATAYAEQVISQGKEVAAAGLDTEGRREPHGVFGNDGKGTRAPPVSVKVRDNAGVYCI